MGKKKRKHYAIEKLPSDIKEAVDEMIKADFTYNEIVDYIKSTGNSVSKWNHFILSEWHRRISVLSWKKPKNTKMLILQNLLHVFYAVGYWNKSTDFQMNR